MAITYSRMIIGVLTASLFTISESNAAESNNYISEAIDAAQHGNCAKAFTLLDRAKAKAPDDYRVYYVAGMTYLRCGKTAQGKSYLEKGIGLAGRMAVQDKYTKGNIAVAYASLGNYPRARLYAEEAKKLFSDAGDSTEVDKMNAFLLNISNQ